MSNCGERILSEEYSDFIIDTTTIAENTELKYDLCYNVVYDTLAVGYAKISTFPKNIFQKYSYSVFPLCYGLMDLNSLDFTGISRLRKIPLLNLQGEGILIGIIDTGIDYTHEAFINRDGTSKIASIWDQTIPSNTPPEGYYYGTEYSNCQINNALLSDDPLSIVPSMDENGHGTFLAGIAAGNENLETGFQGVAAKSQIVVVKLKQAKKFIRDFFFIPDNSICYSETDILLGIKYLVEAAEKLSMPISLCIGLGTSQGGHDSTSALSGYLTSLAARRGIGITIAGGNEGGSGHHFYGTIDPNIGYQTVELRVGSNTTGFSMELWGMKPNVFSIDIQSPTGEYIPMIPARIGTSREIKFLFESSKLYIDYELIETRSGNQLILIRLKAPEEGIWQFRVYSNSKNSKSNPTFHMWLPIQAFLNKETYFTRPEPFYTLTTPGNTKAAIVVTAYNAVNDSIYLEASRGFTTTNYYSPTFAAPGVNMIGPDLYKGYTVASGTSISAAFTAGVVAMILEWSSRSLNRPIYRTAEIKNFLLLGATRNPSINYPNQIWGYGILEVYNSFIIIRGV